MAQAFIQHNYPAIKVALALVVLSEYAVGAASVILFRRNVAPVIPAEAAVPVAVPIGVVFVELASAYGAEVGETIAEMRESAPEGALEAVPEVGAVEFETGLTGRTPVPERVVVLDDETLLLLLLDDEVRGRMPVTEEEEAKVDERLLLDEVLDEEAMGKIPVVDDDEVESDGRLLLDGLELVTLELRVPERIERLRLDEPVLENTVLSVVPGVELLVPDVKTDKLVPDVVDTDAEVNELEFATDPGVSTLLADMLPGDAVDVPLIEPYSVQVVVLPE
ncbi:hypothetical protein Tdes44962_MAKER06670 [Teratosphaeria destructans]|uniref:Uncharacterized protein n=1 Tax=Teratosphaeria destructans TaxID=418781 RepID=A0A9W7T0T3_9PEZI|nr:hypothetical protein Tdes44962_MAKER06670 [Teratosphaeria destructans]